MFNGQDTTRSATSSLALVGACIASLTKQTPIHRLCCLSTTHQTNPLLPTTPPTPVPSRVVSGDTPSPPFAEEAKHGGESKPPAEVPHPSPDQNRGGPIYSVWSQSRATPARPLESITHVCTTTYNSRAPCAFWSATHQPPATLPFIGGTLPRPHSCVGGGS